MRRKVFGLAVLLALAAVTLAQQAQQPTAPNPQPTPPKTHLKVGDPAPDFTLTDNSNKRVKLSDFKGQKNVVLAFYVLAFTGG